MPRNEPERAICATKDCDEVLSPRSQLDRCATCRANIGSWKRNKRPAQILKRRRNLNKFADRMDAILTDEKVTVLERRKHGR